VSKTLHHFIFAIRQFGIGRGLHSLSALAAYICKKAVAFLGALQKLPM